MNIQNEILHRMIGINGSFMRIKAKIHIGMVEVIAIMISLGSDLSIISIVSGKEAVFLYF